MFPKITIITPTYNQGKFIEKSILSVLNQNYPNLEYIIFDGASSDNTIDIIRKYENRITFWKSEKDNGQSHAINKGLQKSTGDIINWLNSDDFLEDGALLYIAECFKSQAVNVVAGYSSYIDESGVFIKNMKFRTFIDKSDIFSTLSNTSFNQPSTFFRKKVFDQITPLNEELHYNMDLFMWLKYLALYGVENIYLSDKNLSIVSYHSEAKTIKFFHKTFQEKKHIYNSLFSSLLNKRAELYFDISAIPKSIKSYSVLKKYYFRFRLFGRNLKGTRTSFSFINFISYIYYSIKIVFK